MILNVLENISSYIWGLPTIILLIGTGIWLTIRLHMIQVFQLKRALTLIFTSKGQGKGDITPFKSLCTALAATLGTGNIVGVATAIKMGGPGALFWMWIAAFIGMATKYAECLLAVKYREIDANGNISGGPMYYIKNGMGPNFKWLATAFAFFGMIAGILGIGTMTHLNSITEIVHLTLGFDKMLVGMIISVLAGIIILKGLRSISTVSSSIVPVMALIYFVITIGVLIVNIDKIPGAIQTIFTSAFTTTAATGGFVGSTIMLAMRSGIARGIFSNESGLGSAPIVAAAAKTQYPAEQGLVSMTGTFIDTIIFCTLTGLCIVVTGAWIEPINGAAMTNFAFTSVFSEWGGYFLMISLVLFAFSSIIGWCYYSERCSVYLFGVKGIIPFRLMYISAIVVASFLKLEEIWTIADICNGLMALPNLIAILCLSKVVISETKCYLHASKSTK